MQLHKERNYVMREDDKNIPSFSVSVTAVELFPRLMLAPEVTRANITVKPSSHSTRSSAAAVKGMHALAPLAEPTGNVRSTEDSGEKSSFEVAENQMGNIP